MEILQSPFVIPLAAFLTVVAIVVVDSVKKLRERELDAGRDLRVREMEHQQRMEELEAACQRERPPAGA